MRKMIFGFTVIFALASCSGKSDQINAAKSQLSKMPAFSASLKDYQYNVVEVPERDVYNMLFKKYQRSYEKLDRFPEAKADEMDRAKKYLDLSGTVEGNKIFYRVHAFRIAGDTLDNLYLFLNDKNSYIDKIEK